MTRRLDLGVIVPDLGRLGGAERLALACIERWRGRFETTLYSTAFAPEVAERLGPAVPLRTLSPRITAPRGTPERNHASLLNGLLLPALWGEEMGEHEAYLAHQWPAQRIRRRPLVWYAHEPRRGLHDLRFEQDPEELVAWAADVREAEGDAWRHVLAPRLRAVQAVLDDAEGRDRPDRVVANSRFTADALQRILGGARPDVVRPGVDVARFDPPSFDEPFFLAVGRLGWHKRPRLLLEALALAPGGRLVFVGDGPLEEACRAMAEALGVGERVELRGAVPDDELRDLLRRCRGVAFVPQREPFGMVALEAMAAGKPLVCTGDGGYGEVVDARCALRVTPEPAAIAEAFEALLADPERARELGAAGRERAAAHPWDATAEALARIVEEVAEEAQPVLPPAPAPHSPRLAVALRLGFGEGAAGAGWAELRAAGAGDAPAAGHYASSLGSTIERQHALLETLAPDLVLLGVPVGRAGPGLRELVAAKRHLERADHAEAPVRFALHARVEPGAEAAVGVLARLVASDLARHASHAREDGAPVLFVEARPGADAAALHAALGDAAPLAVRWLPRADADATDTILRVSTSGGEAPWKEARACLQAASTDPAWIVLDAWNDFAAGCFLEPTRREGARRLALARAFARDLRGDAGPGIARAGRGPG